MGNTCCGCLTVEKDSYSFEPDSRTPLLGSHASIPESRVIANVNVSSARRYRPQEDRRQFESPVEAVTTIEMLPVSFSSVDKTFKDHARLYNELVVTYCNLRSEIHNLKTCFEVETSGIPVLQECLRILACRCGEAKIKIERSSKISLQVSFDSKDISEKCTVPPEQALEPMRYYQNVCKQTSNVLQQAPHIKGSISIIVDDEKTMLSEITKADLPGDEGVNAMKSVMTNIAKLKQVEVNIETIQKDANRIFKELVEGSKHFFASNC